MEASAWVAVAAVVAASAFNLLALWRSGQTLTLAEQAYARTEERYQEDLLERRKDRLRDALIGVSVAVTEFNQANAWYVKLLKDFRAGAVNAGEVQQHELEKLRPGVKEVYRTCQVARFATGDDRFVSDIRGIEEALVAVSTLLTAIDLSYEGIASAEVEFTALRTKAAAKAADLIRVAHHTLAAIPLDDEKPTISDGEVA
jgi:hypothetical protein